MRRKVMDGGFRRIKAAPVAAESPPDPRLALVDLFRDTQVYRDPAVDPNAPLPEGALDFSGDEPMRVTADGSLEPAVQPGMLVDLSGNAPDYGGLFVEDTQEPAEQPATDTGDASPEVAPEAAHEAPPEPEPVVEPVASEPKSNDEDYDPIAAVLG